VRIESRNGSPKEACDILFGIVVSLGLSVAKISAGMVGRSFALLADGLESWADVLSGHVVFFGLKITVKPPDADHPYYGHAKLNRLQRCAWASR
jgi:divalent metal cation (Fe/Co/Zn/Cd) transporter